MYLSVLLFRGIMDGLILDQKLTKERSYVKESAKYAMKYWRNEGFYDNDWKELRKELLRHLNCTGRKRGLVVGNLIYISNDTCSIKRRRRCRRWINNQFENRWFLHDLDLSKTHFGCEVIKQGKGNYPAICFFCTE